MDDWIPLAYARLGAMRDSMTPEEIEAVQKFLGPLDVAPAVFSGKGS